MLLLELGNVPKLNVLHCWECEAAVNYKNYFKVQKRFLLPLQLVKNIMWIVVEDSDRPNSELIHTLDHIKVPYVFLQGRQLIY